MVSVGVMALAGGGASIFTRPDHEVLYSLQPPHWTCTEATCLGMYTLEVGNTGQQPQEYVRVRLRAEALRASILEPNISTFGKVKRAAGVTEEDGIRVYDLGRLKPQERVEIRLVLGYRDQSAAPGWERILVGVDAAQGEAEPGSPAAIMLGRVLYAIFG
jgi:hypothetical protein